MSVSESERFRAKSALIALTSIWGSTFVVLQTGVENMSPFVLVALRFVVAAIGLFLFRPSCLRGGIRNVVPALPLSISLVAGFGLQTTGLETTTPARSAFITALSVIFVPVLDMFDKKRLPRWRLATAALVAGAGIYVLFHPLDGEWKRGDTLTLVAAVLFAYYIVELDRQSKRVGAAELAMAQFLAIAVMAGACIPIFETPRFVPGMVTWLTLLYLGVVCASLNFVLMNWAQARIDAVTAAIIYALEPVIAAGFSLALGREAFRPLLAVGGALVVAATVLASTDPSEPHPVAPPEGID